MKINWSLMASKDFAKLYRWYASKSEKAAKKMFNTLLEKTDRLSSNPYMAPKEPNLYGLPITFRSLVVVDGKFKVIYFIEEDAVHIAYVWDCRQNPQRMRIRLGSIK
jgi:plasmid stabilization system protein ParE